MRYDVLDAYQHIIINTLLDSSKINLDVSNWI